VCLSVKLGVTGDDGYTWPCMRMLFMWFWECSSTCAVLSNGHLVIYGGQQATDFPIVKECVFREFVYMKSSNLLWSLENKKKHWFSVV